VDFRLGKPQPRKSQVAMEFVMLIVIAFMIMIVFAIFTRGRIVDLRGEEEYVSLKDVTHAVQSEITTAANVEDGYERQFTVPLTLDGINYTIGISEGYVVSESENHEYVLRVSPVVGNLTKGINLIRKEGGVVYLN